MNKAALRRGADSLICGLARAAGAISRRLPTPLNRALYSALGAVVATALWPVLPVARRARGEGVRMRPWAWGRSMGRVLAGLFDPRAGVEVDGWGTAADAARGAPVLILGAHLGSWEAAAAELAKRGRRPLVIAAPWRGLPRAQATLRGLRESRGVRSLPRTPTSLREATRHLDDGGAVVVLIDGVAPDRRGRRSRPWLGDRLAAPDGLVAWALRRGAAIWLAEGQGGRVGLRVLASAGPRVRAPSALIHAISDDAVAGLERAVRRSPAEWAWVRPLAVLALVVGVGGCDAPPPPLPLDAGAWRAEVQGLAWEGRMEHGEARLYAESADVSWDDGGPRGRFSVVEVTLPRADGEPSSVRLEAREGEGRWPEGPFELTDVRWEAAGSPGGELPSLRRRDGEWSCGGCDLGPLRSLVDAR